METKYNTFREQYKEFNYNAYNIEEKESEYLITFDFDIAGSFFFTPKMRIPKTGIVFKIKPDDKWIDHFIFHMGLVELISYWKAACPPVINIKAGYLDEEQKKWWKKLYFNGLSEFFYRNNIKASIDDFVTIKTSDQPETTTNLEFPGTKGNLIPIGGGKDSVVTLELMKENKYDNTCFILNPRGATTQCARRGGYDENKIFTAYRTIDKELLNLNEQGFLNGHTPFSAMLAFYTMYIATCLGKKYILLSNESSANESYVKGTMVNHQYSKSYEFEEDFNWYAQKYLTKSTLYFSLLRPLSELQIAKIFAAHPHYFDIFKSCNAGSKENIWCGSCSKCLFVYIILSPFLDPREVEKIFGKNLFEDQDLTLDFEKLIGHHEEKPFECVGTREEINTAVNLTIDRYQTYNIPLPHLLKRYKDDFSHLGKDKTDMRFFDTHNLLPERYLEIVKKAVFDV